MMEQLVPLDRQVRKVLLVLREQPALPGQVVMMELLEQQVFRDYRELLVL